MQFYRYLDQNICCGRIRLYTAVVVYIQNTKYLYIKSGPYLIHLLIIYVTNLTSLLTFVNAKNTCLVPPNIACPKSWKKIFDSDLTWLKYKKVPVKIMKSSWQVDVHSWQVDIHSWQVDIHSWQINKNFLANLVKTSW